MGAGDNRLRADTRNKARHNTRYNTRDDTGNKAWDNTGCASASISARGARSTSLGARNTRGKTWDNTRNKARDDTRGVSTTNTTNTAGSARSTRSTRSAGSARDTRGTASNTTDYGRLGGGSTSDIAGAGVRSRIRPSRHSFGSARARLSTAAGGGTTLLLGSSGARAGDDATVAGRAGQNLVRLVELEGADAEVVDTGSSGTTDDATALVWDEADGERDTSVAAACLAGAAILAAALGFVVGADGGASAPLADLAGVAGGAVSAALMGVEADAESVAETLVAGEAVGALVVSLAGLRGGANDVGSANAGEAKVAGLTAFLATSVGVGVVEFEVDGFANFVDTDGTGRADGLVVAACALVGGDLDGQAGSGPAPLTRLADDAVAVERVGREAEAATLAGDADGARAAGVLGAATVARVDTDGDVGADAAGAELGTGATKGAPLKVRGRVQDRCFIIANKVD